MILRGVLFRSTIRGGHASLAIAVTANLSIDDDDGSVDSSEVVLVVIRFDGPEWSFEGSTRENIDDTISRSKSNEYISKMTSPKREIITRMRSNIRRLCKIGNELEFTGDFEKQSSNACTKSDGADARSPINNFNCWSRFVVDYHPQSSGNENEDCNNKHVRLVQVQKWDATRCQMLQRKYFHAPKRNQQTKSKDMLRNESNIVQVSSCVHHKSGLGKRQQGEVVADFLLHAISTKYQATIDVTNSSFNEAILERFGDHDFKYRLVQYKLSSDTANISDRNANVTKLFPHRKAGTNDLEHDILDVAGGAGHVSLALTLRGVRSTVIDPRSTIGSLPGRDRKVLKKSKKEPFGTYRAWFGSRPDGIDTFFREGCQDYFAHSPSSSTTKSIASMFEPDRKESIPVCTIDSEDQLLRNCTAIVALHPDEATGVIVETAVKHRIPFVIM